MRTNSDSDMRKISILSAFAAALLLGSCTKTPVEFPQPTTVRHFTAECTDVVSKTAIEDGKQVWKAGDQIWISDGVNSEIVTVPAADDSKSSISFTTTTITGSKVYAVFPANVALKAEGDRAFFNIPNTTDGSFASANIMVSKTMGNSFGFKNVTSVIKFSLTSADVKQISITSAREASSGSDRSYIAGAYYYDYDEQRIWGVSNEAVSSITVKFDGPGTYYVPVYAGSLAAGAKFVFTNSEGETAVRTTGVDNTFNVSKFKSISVDDIVAGLTFDSDWKGGGTLGDPYLVTCAEDMVKISTADDYFTNKTFKLVADIVLPENFKPIGNGKTFYGYFNGDNHTVTLTSFASGQTYVGLFGRVGTSSTSYSIPGIKDIHVTGDITISGDASIQYYGSVLAYGTNRLNIYNCKSSVNVNISSSALQYGGGVVGYAGGSNGCRYVGNSNTGNINFTTSKSRASRYFGGVYGYIPSASAVTPTSSFNTGDLTVECTSNDNYATHASGIASSNSNSAAVSYCYNLGDITVKSKTTRQNCSAASGLTSCVKCDHSYNAGKIRAYYGASYDLEGYTGGISGYYQYNSNYSFCYSLEGAAPDLMGYNSNASTDSTVSCGTFTISPEGGYVPALEKDLIQLIGSAYFEVGEAPDYFPVRK